MRIGVCYYPEHWPESEWSRDARQMVALGISVVRIGEFAWSRLEPRDGELDLSWLKRALDTLGDAGLSVVLGTPTATPPKWLVDKLPGMLAVDEDGQVRHFGSRRHYCFSSLPYRKECARIVEILGEAFGQHPAVKAWQIDNEYGCHSTVVSYSDSAKTGFHRWCAEQYGTIEQLNQRWGNVFWSMEYQSFEQIELPAGTVTEANPAHRMAFWRYSSDQVRQFNQLQTNILRRLSPGRDLAHNYMGNFVEFDHYCVAEDLDIASWDSYPLGFLDRDSADPEDLARWYRTGHPDCAAFHHDLYRGVGKGRWWVMEQQPGPVNWAPHNPSPLDGMVRLWGWEAFAHGAEVVSYFRWRQMANAQEQMHTGLCLPSGKLDTGAWEAAKLAEEITELQLSTPGPHSRTRQAPVVIVFDYNSDRMQRILCSGGDAHDPLLETQRIYSAVRQCGVDIDILPADADLTGYKVVLLCTQLVSDESLAGKLKNLAVTTVLFPGTGSRNTDCTMPGEPDIGAFRQLIDIKISRTESLPGNITLAANGDSGQFCVQHWRERVDSPLTPAAVFSDGWGFYYSQNRVHYLNGNLIERDLNRFIKTRLLEAAITLRECQEGLRFRTLGNLHFAFNYGPSTVSLEADKDYLLGASSLAAGELAVWRQP